MAQSLATTGTDGKYTVTLEPGKASANETITVVAKMQQEKKVSQLQQLHQPT